MTTTHSALIPRRNRFLRALAAATMTLATPLVLAQSNPMPTTPSGKALAFSIVSIKRHGNAPGGGMEGCYVDRCHFIDRPLRAIIMTAYNDLTLGHISGGPSWMMEDRFDLDAKIDPEDMPATPLSSRQLADMLQPVLADRFQIRIRHETRTLRVYNIVLAKGGLKMKESAGTAPPPGRCFFEPKGNGFRSYHYCTMNDITHILENPTGRSLIDKTGLTRHYDFELHWTPDDTPPDSPLAGGPSIFTAVQEQLGLRLEPSTAPLDVLVIDSAQKPTPN